MGKTNPNGFALPSFLKNNLVDAVGAGDALLAYASLSLFTSKSVVISSIIGSVAAACECEKDGNIVISPDEVLERLEQIRDSSKYSTTTKLWEL